MQSPLLVHLAQYGAYGYKAQMFELVLGTIAKLTGEHRVFLSLARL